MPPFRLLAPNAIVGYGFPEASLELGIARRPDAIVVDGGSTDPGPYYLGSGKCLNSRPAMKRDLRLMLNTAVRNRIPLVVGSCGGSGSEPQLAAVADIVREIAREDSLKFRLALIHAEQDKAALQGWRRSGRIAPLYNVPELTDEAIEESSRVVAMMGPEPYAKALDEGAQVILAGRSSDPAPFASLAMRANCPPAPSWYAGKMLECGASAAVPEGHDSLFATVFADRVEIEPPNPMRRCTPLSIANFSLHENASPCFHVEPGGLLDTSECRIEAVSDRAVAVSGMRWTPRPYSVKLEGAGLAGYRSIAICGTRDPVLIAGVDPYLAAVRATVEAKAAELGIGPERYRLIYRVYGRDGIMAAREPLRHAVPHELGILIEVIGTTQAEASAVMSLARLHTLHSDFPGRLCKEGNMAMPFSPAEVEAGPAYRFTVFHVLQIDDPLALFAIEYEEL
jgi:hypothetical protein